MSTESIVLSVGGGLITILLGIIAFFLGRLLKQHDTLMDKVQYLTTQLGKYEDLVAYLKQELETVKKECTSLRRSFNHIDKVLYARNIKINPNDPDETT